MFQNAKKIKNYYLRPIFEQSWNLLFEKEVYLNNELMNNYKMSVTPTVHRAYSLDNENSNWTNQESVWYTHVSDGICNVLCDSQQKGLSNIFFYFMIGDDQSK